MQLGDGRRDQIRQSKEEQVIEFVCVLCGEKFSGWGHNPRPVVNPEEHQLTREILGENPRCCGDCNALYVLPARLGQEVKGELYDRHGNIVGSFGTEEGSKSDNVG